MRYHRITYTDVNNGQGNRVTLWLSGCSHHCPGCHNPQTWAFHSGREFTEEAKEKLFEILSLPYVDGVTLSGGDPLDSAAELLPLVHEIRERYPEKNIWLYTGYEEEEIKDNPLFMDVVKAGVDIVVVGRFILSQKTTTLPFRGSTNQKILAFDRESGEFNEVDDSTFD